MHLYPFLFILIILNDRVSRETLVTINYRSITSTESEIVSRGTLLNWFFVLIAVSRET